MLVLVVVTATPNSQNSSWLVRLWLCAYYLRPRRSEVPVVLSPVVSVCVVHRAPLGESEPLLYTAPCTVYAPVSGRHLLQAPSARVVPYSRPISCLLSPSHPLLPSLYTPTFIRPSLYFYPTPPPLNFDCYTFYSLPLLRLIIDEQAHPRKCHRRYLTDPS
jgi:hypothetical protein